jgi:hypothetical protein
MEPWTRDDTRSWLGQLENRIEDIEFYLKHTEDWCEERDVYDEFLIASCRIITVLWVSEMRQESISKREIYELIGVKDWYDAPEESFSLSDQYKDMDINELLELAISRQN